MHSSEWQELPLIVQGLSAYPVPLTRLLDRIPFSVVILDIQKRVVFLNRSMEALVGVSLDQVAGIPCFHAVRSNLCSSRCPFKAMGPDSEPVSQEGDIIDRNREKIPVRVIFSPVLDMEGQLAGWLECFEDLRARQDLDKSRSTAYSFGPLLGHSREIERLFRMVPGIAQTDSSVLITGETGTGKDILAEVIHQQSERSKGPFVKVNCGALPETLLESELFGHQKGAFTGATANKPGRFKLAHLGSLFLTEIGDLPKTLQVKLLSFLDDQVIYPLGSTKGVQVNVRIIAATNRDLQAMVREGDFREDLLFRLNVVRLHLPPLREREGDVRLLLDHFLQHYMHKFNKQLAGFSKESLHTLLNYPYPGNVRELKNIVEFAVNVSQGREIELDNLPGYLFETLKQPQPAEVADSQELKVSDLTLSPDGQSWPELERQMILKALLQAKGRKNVAADILGWGRSTLWRKMKQYEIEA